MKTSSKLLSCVLTTRDKTSFVNCFIQSIEKSNLSQKVELIIIIQSNSGITFSHNRNIEIKEIHTGNLSLSKARNIGLQYAKGLIVSFPDDDCLYDRYLIKKLEELHQKFCDSSFVGILKTLDNKDHPFSGKIKLRNLSKVLISNYIDITTSVTVFFRNKNLPRFDERFGLGANFPSCEEHIFTQSLLYGQKDLVFCKELKVFHPLVNYDEKRLRQSSIGHGAFIGLLFHKYGLLNKYTINALWVYYLRNIVGLLFLKKTTPLNFRKIFVKYRIKGFCEFFKCIR
ncbi:MAG: glycosyltransferase [Verrucomicrobiota bacterium]